MRFEYKKAVLLVHCHLGVASAAHRLGLVDGRTRWCTAKGRIRTLYNLETWLYKMHLWIRLSTQRCEKIGNCKVCVGNA